MNRRAAVLFLLLLAPAFGWSLTLSEIRTRVRRNCRDTDTNASTQRYSDATLTGIINDVQREVNADVWAVENSTSYVLTAGVTYYALPTDFIGESRATFRDRNGMTTQLTIFSEKNILDSMPDFEHSGSGSPSRFFVRQSKTGGAAMQIAYLPVPTSSSTGTVRLDYVALPADMSSDSDVPFNGALRLYAYHAVLEYGATLKIKLIEAASEEAKAYMDLFVAQESRMKSGVGGAPGFKPSAGVGGPR